MRIRASTRQQKTFTRNEMDRILRHNGWTLVRTSASHAQYKHPNYTDVISITLRPNRMVCQRLIKAYNLSY